MKPGDAFLHNSPYHGNTHPADFTILIPVFDDNDRHRFSVLAKSHQADCGNAQPTTYVADAKPIFVANCTPCHVAGGGNPNKWDQYDQAKANINGILDRIQRDPGATGFMPNGGSKLSAEKIAILKKWLDDGLLEN